MSLRRAIPAQIAPAMCGRRALQPRHGRQKQRRALADLDDRLLADIGVSRHAAARKSARRFRE